MVQQNDGGIWSFTLFATFAVYHSASCGGLWPPVRKQLAGDWPKPSDELRRGHPWSPQIWKLRTKHGHPFSHQMFIDFHHGIARLNDGPTNHSQRRCLTIVAGGILVHLPNAVIFLMISTIFSLGRPRSSLIFT